MVLLAIVDVAVLLAVDGAVRGLAAWAANETRDVPELGFTGADVEVFDVVVVIGFAVVDFTDVADNLALGTLLLLLVVVVELFVAVVDDFNVDDVSGFLEVVVLTSPFTAVVAGFLANRGAFFSANEVLFVAVAAKLVRVVDGAVDGFAIPTVLLVAGAVVFFTVLAAVEGFGTVESLAGAGLDGNFADVGAFLSAVNVDVFDVVFVAAVLVVLALVVTVAFCVADLDATIAGLGSSTGLITCSSTGVTVSNKLAVAVVSSFASDTSSVDTLSMLAAVDTSFAGFSTDGS